MDDARSDENEAKVSRRAVGRALGAAAAGAVGAGALAGLGAQPAEATDGGGILAGRSNLAESTTQLRYNGSAGVKLVALFTDSTLNPGISGFTAALAGWAGGGATEGPGGVANGVYGFTDNTSGNGVVGVNHGDSGGPMTGAGVLGRTEIDGGTGVRADASGVSSGFGLTASGGSEGTGVQATGGIGVLASGGSVGVEASGDSAGVFGSSNNGVGVQAIGSTAVFAEGDDVGVEAFGPVAVEANGTVRGGVFSGSAAQVSLTPGSQSTHPVSGNQGDLYVDSTGALWFCKVGGDTATWTQIA